MAVFSSWAVRLVRVKLPPGTRIKTPSGRLARVLFVDEEERVHVRYTGSDKVNANEQGTFPHKLLSIANVVGEPK